MNTYILYFTIFGKSDEKIYSTTISAASIKDAMYKLRGYCSRKYHRAFILKNWERTN